ncbi:methyltransferase domain-containing protein [candidate division GN15 bacterium]|nr:methyltransferase domain-containing protein [candidate division GN15 bacterium]
MCQACNIPLDEARSESFANRLTEILNHGALSLMISIGHRTGLFDTLAKLDWATSVELADAANLHERYVREWLGAVTLGEIVEHEPDPDGGHGRFRLPAEHAAWLTREATPDNIAVYGQYISTLGSVEDQIVECFHNGGGVPYEAYSRFHPVMAEDSGQTVLPALVDHILPLAPDLIEKLETGIDCLDIGCGSGRAYNLLARTYPNSRFVGYDFSEEAIAHARREAKELGLTNVRFEVRDCTELDEHQAYDLITAFDAIHDQVWPDKVLRAVRQALKPDGTFLMQDIAASSYVHKNTDLPLGALLYTVSCLHCMTVSLAGGGLGLGAMWGEEKALEMLNEAGFDRVQLSHLPHDIQNAYYVISLDKAA